jgi:molybdopterin converting factor small subunit
MSEPQVEVQHQLWVPALHRDLTGGLAVVKAGGSDVGRVLAAVDARYPGLAARLTEAGRLRPSIVVAVNGVISPHGLRCPLEGPSEIHFVRSAAGG